MGYLTKSRRMMGLDQYAYLAARQADEWDNHQELAYWRKHPNLQGWMEKLFLDKGGNCDSFNGVELELTWDDVDRLEQDIQAGQLPSTQGFFFGNDSDEHYKEHDLDFCRRAKAELFLGRRVFYNSSW